MVRNIFGISLLFVSKIEIISIVGDLEFVILNNCMIKLSFIRIDIHYIDIQLVFHILQIDYISVRNKS